MPLSWSHTVIFVNDIEKMLDFYMHVLGFRITDRGDIPGRNYEIVFLSQDPEEHHQIGLATSRPEVGPSNSVAHIAFRLDGLRELRHKIELLDAENVALRYTTHGNTWSVYFQDPELNGFELLCDTPWQVRQPRVDTWDASLDDDALLAWTKNHFKDAAGFEPSSAMSERRRREWR